MQGNRCDIQGLKDLDTDTLRDQFATLYRSAAPPRLGRDLLERAIAYRLQEQQAGRLSASARRRLAALAKELREAGDISGQTPSPVKPGTRLLREWQGETHEVTVLAAGFAYRDARYRSLTRIAREITGSHRSGPAFFGLSQGRSK